ncbi:DNA polymerase III subunit alpha [Filibacter tadaridae]|nr:DNA polymerase III subunit alpha [Filibacter tadaridae]
MYPQIVTGADLLRGIIKLDTLAPLLKRRGATAVAIVNSKLYGARSFYKVMQKQGIRPVFGLSIYIEIEKGKSVFAYVYAKDDEGFRNLLKISSAVSTKEFETLPLQWLGAYSKGCILLVSITDKSWEGVNWVDTLSLLINRVGKDSLVVGVSRPGGVVHFEEETIENSASALGLSIAAVYESRYLDKEDAFAYEVAEAIRTGYKLNDPSRPKNIHNDAYVPEEQEIKEWFIGKHKWLENMADILLTCNADLPPNEQLMPIFPVPEGETAPSLLAKNCMVGLKKRLGTIEKQYEARLRYEIDVITKMGFADYFLIVEDFMRYSADNNILTGPGRGSSAGSLVAFALGITDVDPIKYGLIFERFLNPGRVTLPDIDIDFADNRRSEVIEYVARKYGQAYVAQIITFGTLSARSVARNVARVFDFSNEEMAFLSKEIPSRSRITLEEAIGESKAVLDWIAIDPIRSRWLKAAQTLEGLPRNASTHAAGVILSPVPLVEVVPLQNGADDIYLTQWPMGDVEERGLLKMDFLGLRNLTLLDRIRAMISYDKGVQINFEAIPLDDESTFTLFRTGDMTGIFQFESDGMRNALRLIRPNSFEDIFAITALYRPGPMENIPLYSRRKNGEEKASYLHPLLEPILSETYGVIVYQEQIMQIAVQFAGFTMGEADLLRRAVSKKKREILQQERIHFTQSAIQNGFTEKAATEVYDLIVKFADYGFPKSHAVAYSLISYRLAFLKANETAYFYAALLSSMTGNNDKTMALLREAEAHGVSVLPPSVNHSQYMYTVDHSSIRIGLGAIKGVTPTFYKALKEARHSTGKWKNLFDMAASLGSDIFTEKAIQPLIKAGALDVFGESRAVLLASIDAAIAHALFIRPDDGEDLLSDLMPAVARPKYSPGGTMPRMALLEYEREVLGFYLSEHPAGEAKKTANETYTDIAETGEQGFVKIVGLVMEIKRIRTKKGEAMAFVTVQDETGEISCTFFPKQYATSSSDLVEMSMIHIDGTLEKRGGKVQILVQQTKNR